MEFKTLHEYYQKHWVSKHRYPLHNKVLCICLWARPNGRDTDTGFSFAAPPDLSANYSHVCQQQCDQQSLESAETTTHHLGKLQVLIYEV